MERSTLVVDCDKAHLRDVCTQHQIMTVPSLFTYHAGDLVSSVSVVVALVQNAQRVAAGWQKVFLCGCTPCGLALVCVWGH